MQDTLCTRTTFVNWSGSGGSHNWTSRWVFFLLRQPLGDSIKDRATALQQMEGEQRNAQTASRHHLVDVDAEFDTRITRLRVVRETLFGGDTVLGYGNFWSKALRSRAVLCSELQEAARADGHPNSIVSCLRGLLGMPREPPRVGRIWKAV